MKPKTEIKRTSDAVAIMDRMAGGSPDLRRLTEEARINAAVAQLIYDARTKAGLSQAELADKIGTKQSAISRLEDADYDGHSLSMLQTDRRRAGPVSRNPIFASCQGRTSSPV